MPAEQQPTSAAAWGAKKKGFVVELPSGQFARIKRSLDFTILLKQGRIPNPLNGVIMEMVKNETTEFDMEKLDSETLQQFFTLVDDIVCQCFVEPRCQQPPKKKAHQDDETYDAMVDAWEPEEGCIHVNDVDPNDKMFVFSVAQGAATELAPFRKGPASDVEVVAPVQDVEAASL